MSIFHYFEKTTKNILCICGFCISPILQEVFHVYLNKFENAVTHLFLVVSGNN